MTSSHVSDFVEAILAADTEKVETLLKEEEVNSVINDCIVHGMHTEEERERGQRHRN